MYTKLHDRFQYFLDSVIESQCTLDEKKATIKTHLLSYQQQYEAMLRSFFKEEQLTQDNYFYITYTYNDLPIDLNKPDEFVVSFLYDLENGMHFEFVIFNVNSTNKEFKEIFSQNNDFYC